MSNSESISRDPIGTYYSRHHDAFHSTYGDALQFFQLRTDNASLDHQLELLDIQRGDVLIDAGCGIAGPAIYFAGRTECSVIGFTLSQKQFEEGVNKISNAGLEERVKIYCEDLRNMDQYCTPSSVDKIYFLESLSHLEWDGKMEVLQKCNTLLKPGGRIFVQDFFLGQVRGIWSYIKRNYNRWRSKSDAFYYVEELSKFLDQAGNAGFSLEYLEKLEITKPYFDEIGAHDEIEYIEQNGRYTYISLEPYAVVLTKDS